MTSVFKKAATIIIVITTKFFTFSFHSLIDHVAESTITAVVDVQDFRVSDNHLEKDSKLLILNPPNPGVVFGSTVHNTTYGAQLPATLDSSKHSETDHFYSDGKRDTSITAY